MGPFIVVSENSSDEHESVPNLSLKSKHLHDRGPGKLFIPLGMKRLLLKEDSRFRISMPWAQNFSQNPLHDQSLLFCIQKERN